jgi:hypothetical protein
MKKTLLLCGALLALTASAALANTGTVTLAWNDCSADGGVASTTWPCTVNSTQFVRFIGSFNINKQFDYFVAEDITLDAQFTSAGVPDWWQMGGGGCRQGTMSTVFDATSLPGGGAGCPDTWDNGANGTGGISLYDVGYGGANRIRIKIAVARPSNLGITLDPGQEYLSFIVRFNRSKTVGTPSCAGCNTPVSMVLNSITLYNNPPIQTEAEQFELSAPGPSGSCAMGNGGDPVTCAATPTRNKTWGAVKALYR